MTRPATGTLAGSPTNRTVTPPQSDLPVATVTAVVEGLRLLVADLVALYIKTKNFHWHVQGPHFRDYHLLFDEQAEQLLEVIDAAAERALKLGGDTVRSIGEVATITRVAGSDRNGIAAEAMLDELARDHRELARHLRALHQTADDAGDVATASLVETWIDEGERRAWFLRVTRR